MLIPENYHRKLISVTKGRVPFSPATRRMTEAVDLVINDFKLDHPELFREKADGSVLPRISCDKP